MPLVFPGQWSDRWCEDSDGAGEDGGERDSEDSEEAVSQSRDEVPAADQIYRALLVFAAGYSPLSPYHAIYLANVPLDGTDPPQYEPRCKIIPNWNAGKTTDLRTLDASTLSTTDKSDLILVTVQSIPCHGERRYPRTDSEPRTVGLVQVVFDLDAVCSEIVENRSNPVVERQSNWDIWGRGGGARRATRLELAC